MERSTSIAIASLVIASIVALTTTVVVLHGEQSTKEAKAWGWGTYPKLCPPLQLKCGSSLTKSQCSEVWKGARHNAAQLTRRLYVTQPQPNKPVIVVHGPTAVDKLPGGLCSEHGGLLGTFGRTERSPTWGPVISRFTITICFNKLDRARAHQNSSVGVQRDAMIRNVARLGIAGVAAHELLHPFLGDRPDRSHPRNGAGLMAAQPTTMTIGPTVKSIFKIHIDPACR